MAKKELKKNKKAALPLETRIVASFSLLEFCRLDVQNLNNDDLDMLFQHVQKINSLALEDEKILDIAIEHDLEAINTPNKLKERIQYSRVINTYKTLGYFGLCSGTEHNHLPEAQEIVASVLHDLNIKEADNLADNIFHKTLDEETATYLFTEVNKRKSKLIDNLRTDMQTYNAQKQQHPLIENLRPDLEEYTYSAKQKTLEIPFSCPENDEIRQLFKDDVRDNFDKTVRHDFLKLYGCLMNSGKQTSEGLSNASDYDMFKKFITSEYNDEIIDSILNIKKTELADKDIETIRKEKFKAKGEELYFMTVAALLCEKNRHNLEYNTSCNWNMFVINNINTYIKGLLEGRNDIKALALVDPYSEKSGKDIYRDAVGDQCIAVHHGNSTVAASTDVTRCFFPELFDDKQMDRPEIRNALKALNQDMEKALTAEGKKEIRKKHRKDLRNFFLRPIFQKAINMACALTNQKSGFTLVVGKDKHQSMEPRGKIIIKPYSDNSILAARVNPIFLKRIGPSLPDRLWQGIQKYINPDTDKKTLDIAVSLSLPENEVWQKVRTTLKAEEKTQVSVLQKHQRYSH